MPIMKTSALAFLLILSQTAAVQRASAAPPSAAAQPQSIPFDQLGAEAQKQYSGDGIRIIPTKDGAKLKAIMQDLEAEATPEGLWITSTADEDAGKPNRFRVRATEVGRVGRAAAPPAAARVPAATTSRNNAVLAGASALPLRLSPTGTVRASKDAAHWLRPGLIEQYSVSTDGVRQDFIITHRPARNGEALRLELDIHGAQAKKAPDGAKLTIKDTGRELAYTRLKVTDATGRELPAEMHVPAPHRLQVLVQDDFAVYPVCIDPTFSDADWVSLNSSVPGVFGSVSALVMDGNSNLYIGGNFMVVGGVAANCVAKWDGSSWSGLGLGMGGVSYPSINALAISGGELYAGGYFRTAGGITTNSIAKWTGSTWSALGTGMNVGASVFALAVSGGDLYAAGDFTAVGGAAASRVAKWNGISWAALGSGASYTVQALAASGSDVYIGGDFTHAGGVLVNHVAKWDGNSSAFRTSLR
jgi:hypothetical protein